MKFTEKGATGTESIAPFTNSWDVYPLEVAEEEEGWEASPELLARLEKARQEVREGNCITLHTKDDINAYFDSL